MSEARVVWNKANVDESFIRDNFHKMSAREIGEALGVSREVVNNRVRAMGLRKTKIPFVALEGEIVKEIPDAHGYGVTNKSRVVNLTTMTLVKPKTDREGYLKITLFVRGSRIERRLHRLVAEAFIENPENLPFVNHIDGDKTNASLGNLEWVTPKQNAAHASENGLLRVGESSPHAKITEEQARAILEDSRQGMSKNDLLQKHPYATIATVTKIANRTRWRHLDRSS